MRGFSVFLSRSLLQSTVHKNMKHKHDDETQRKLKTLFWQCFISPQESMKGDTIKIHHNQVAERAFTASHCWCCRIENLFFTPAPRKVKKKLKTHISSFSFYETSINKSVTQAWGVKNKNIKLVTPVDAGIWGQRSWSRSLERLFLGPLVSLHPSGALRQLGATKREVMLNPKKYTLAQSCWLVGSAEGLEQAFAKIHLVCRVSQANIWCGVCVDFHWVC